MLTMPDKVEFMSDTVHKPSEYASRLNLADIPIFSFEVRSMTFDLATFLVTAGVGRRLVQLKPKQVFFAQGSSADSIFYLQTGRAKLTVVSHEGKEATIALIPAGEFVGEESLASVGVLHMATATAITACTALRIEREEMIRMMHEENSLSEMYLKFLLVRSIRAQIGRASCRERV